MKEALAIIKKHEGLRLKAYICPAGKWTIGFGNTYYSNGRPVRPGDTLASEEEAEELLQHTVAGFAAAVDGLVKVPITENQRNALISFTYNLGTGNLSRSTLLRLLNAGNYTAAAKEFEKWVSGGGKRLPGLVTRRKEEKTLFLKKP